MNPKLAIDGGSPVREQFLPFGRPCLGDEEINGVVEVLQSRWIGTGPKAVQFEKLFAEYVHSRHALAVNSCTAALHLSLIAAGIGPGDEVITSPLTFAATANVVVHVGAKPVFADIDPLTLNIDPRNIEKAINPRHEGHHPGSLWRAALRHGRDHGAGKAKQPDHHRGRGPRCRRAVQRADDRLSGESDLLQLLRQQESDHR